jgi:mercuric ion transport protein
MAPEPSPALPKDQPLRVRNALLTGGVAAFLASTCCLGPLILITLGVSGAWIGNLAALEPYRPAFILVAVAALFFAGRRIWRSTATCTPGQVCALQRSARTYKLLFGLVALLVIIALAFPVIAPWFY